jgi:hypothetical protein
MILIEHYHNIIKTGGCMHALDPLTSCTNLEEFDHFINNELSQFNIVDHARKRMFVSANQQYGIAQLVDRFMLLKKNRVTDSLCLIPKITQQLQALNQFSEQCEIREKIQKTKYSISCMNREFTRLSPNEKTLYFEDLCDNFDQLCTSQFCYDHFYHAIFVRLAFKETEFNLDKARQKKFLMQLSDIRKNQIQKLEVTEEKLEEEVYYINEHLAKLIFDALINAHSNGIHSNYFSRSLFNQKDKLELLTEMAKQEPEIALIVVNKIKKLYEQQQINSIISQEQLNDLEKFVIMAHFLKIKSVVELLLGTIFLRERN